MKPVLYAALIIALSLTIALPVQLTARGLLWVSMKLLLAAKGLEAWKYDLYIKRIRPLYVKADLL